MLNIKNFKNYFIFLSIIAGVMMFIMYAFLAVSVYIGYEMVEGVLWKIPVFTLGTVLAANLICLFFDIVRFGLSIFEDKFPLM